MIDQCIQLATIEGLRDIAIRSMLQACGNTVFAGFGQANGFVGPAHIRKVFQESAGGRFLVGI